jgi:hypothetical protein
MTIKSIEQLLAQADATLADNVTGDISASDVRTLIKDFLDTIGPGYGVLNLTTLSKACTATASVITPWTAVEEQTAGYYNISVANGQVTRLVTTAGLVGATDFIVATGSVNGPNNSQLTLELYKNGAPTGIKQSVTCAGTSDNVGFNLTGLEYTTVDAVYELRASSVPNGNHNFSTVQLLCQSQAVRAF